jgi:hypothetical protein
VLLDWLVGEIRRRKPANRPLKAGIDGRCASGKTFLADSLAPRLRAYGFEVLRPSVDGFHHPKAYRYRNGEYSAAGYYDDAFDYAAVVSHLLQPLSGTRFLSSVGGQAMTCGRTPRSTVRSRSQRMRCCSSTAFSCSGAS